MHAPGHLRDAFLEWAERPGHTIEDKVGQDIFYDGEPRPIRWILGQLWNCSDILPRGVWQDLGFEGRSGDDARNGTYGGAVQRLSRLLDE